MLDKNQTTVDVMVLLWMIIFTIITTAAISGILYLIFTQHATYFTIFKYSLIPSTIFFGIKYYEYLKKGFE